jgi:hypothetical protein
MASFFALNTFQVVVETNICLSAPISYFCKTFESLRAARQHHNLTSNQRYWVGLLYRLEPRAGTIPILVSTAGWLNKISNEVAVFRNVQFVIKDTFSHPKLCTANMIGPQAIQWVWALTRPNPRGRNAITVSLWHPMQLAPHFVSCPIQTSAANDYARVPYQAVRRTLFGDDPLFRTFNCHALCGLAYVIGHYGNFR